MTVSAALGSAFWGRSLFAAEWRNLCFVAYAVDPALLATKLPTGLSLELVDHHALALLVFWQARYPTVLGVKTPEHAGSVELSLRFLVREGERRGSVTVREDSSSTLVAAATRSLFHEPARRSELSVEESAGPDAITVAYRANATLAHVFVEAAREPSPIEHDSLEYLLVQRPFAYTRAKDGELMRYDLDHPLWRAHAVREHRVEVDYARLYGDEWAWLGKLSPLTVVLCEGSAVRASLPE